jgi:K+-sensing histidine kinase KdpD
VTLSADLEGLEQIVAVSDDGTGISAADLPYLGARFFRGGDLNARPKGLGLGLALVTSALELHGAVLEVESAEGRGPGSRSACRRSAPPARHPSTARWSMSAPEWGTSHPTPF